MDHLGDHSVGYLGEIGLQRVGYLLKLGPEGFIYKSFRNPGHHGGVSLPVVSVRLDAVSTEERREYFARPHVAHGKPILEGWVLFFNLRETFEYSLPCPRRGLSFARGGRAGVECFYQSELFDEFGFVQHGCEA